MRVIQVKCPQCNSPIQQKQKDKIFFCTQCNATHVRNGGVEKLDVEIAEFNSNTQGERAYAPFWRVYATFIVRSKSVEGGSLFKLSKTPGKIDYPAPFLGQDNHAVLSDMLGYTEKQIDQLADEGVL